MPGHQDKTILTPKQSLFCQEYIIDHNGKQAAIRTGYKETTAENQASRLLSKEKVKVEVKRLDNIQRAKSQNMIQWIRDKHLEFVDKCEKTGDYVNASRNLEGLGKTYAAYVDRQENVNSDQTQPLTIDEQIEHNRAQIRLLQASKDAGTAISAG